VNLRRKGNSFFLYLINFTSEMRRPIQRIVPLTGLEIELFLKEDVKNVKTLWSGSELKFTRKVDSLTFTLPDLGDYEVIKIST
jgi:hypothetical protein